MLDSNEKWVRSSRQCMTTEKCKTKICGPRLPRIKEMRTEEPVQSINAEGQWQDAYPCPDPEKLPNRNCTKEEADQCMTRKKKTEKPQWTIYKGLAHCKIYLHLFSGRRRQHDFAHWVDAMAHKKTGATVW